MAFHAERVAKIIERELSTILLLEAKNNVIPVAVSSKETINELEDWDKGRALYSNKSMKEINKKKSALDKLDNLDLDDIL